MCGDQWPGVQGAADVANAELRLLGGASFERSMADFQAAVTQLPFPGGEPLPAGALGDRYMHSPWLSLMLRTVPFSSQCSYFPGGQSTCRMSDNTRAH